MSRMLNALKRTAGDYRPIQGYFKPASQALVCPFLQAERLTAQRRPRESVKETEKAAHAYAALGADVDLPDLRLHAIHQASTWELPQGSLVNLHGLGQRQLHLLHYFMVLQRPVLPPEASMAFLRAEMGWSRIGQKSPFMFDRAPTVTSKMELLMLQLSGDMQFRWVAPDELWGLQGMPLADVVGSHNMDMVFLRFSNCDLTKFAGQAFHMPSMATFVMCALMVRRW